MTATQSASPVRTQSQSASPPLEDRWQTTVSCSIFIHEPVWTATKDQANRSYAVQGPAPYRLSKETTSLYEAAKLLSKAGTANSVLIALEEFVEEDGRTYSVRQCEWDADSESWGAWK